jgi:acetoin utilization deacetylase AcuC-like enzyme
MPISQNIGQACGDSKQNRATASYTSREKTMSDQSRREFLKSSVALVSAGAGTSTTWVQSKPIEVFYHSDTLRHEPSGAHPENAGRLGAVMDAVRALERQRRLVLVSPRPATEADVLRVHSKEYFSKVRTEIAAGRTLLSTGDTELSHGSLDASLAAAGTVLSAVDAVMSGRVRRAFCAGRPPGHHASGSRGMGFCIFNNLAIGARYAMQRYGVGKLLIADWDVHHGNGTQEVFWSDSTVLFFDTHQHPWYPGTGLASEIGEGKGRGLTINRPFPAGSGRREILGAFKEVLLPAAGNFRPELVMISAGFDSRTGDPLGQFTLTDQDFADLTDIMCDIAERHAGGRLVSVLEGGYALTGLAQAVGAHLGRLSS